MDDTSRVKPPFVENPFPNDLRAEDPRAAIMAGVVNMQESFSSTIRQNPQVAAAVLQTAALVLIADRLEELTKVLKSQHRSMDSFNGPVFGSGGL